MEEIKYVILNMREVMLNDHATKRKIYNYMKTSVKMFRDFYPDNNYEEFRSSFDEGNLMSLITSWCMTHTHAFLATINIQGEEQVVGVYVLQMFPSIVERGLIAQEIHFMVNPNYGAANIGVKLLRLGIEKVKEHNCLWIDNYVTMGYRPEKMNVLYKRVGSKKIGEIFRTKTKKEN